MSLPAQLKRYYGDCEGPFGFPMQSAAAKEVEGLWNALPRELKDMGLIRRGQVKAVDLKEGERADVSFVTTDSLDRDAEVVLPAGGDWKQFRKNPVVPFGHDYGCAPVGRAMWVKRESKGAMDGWLAKTEYMPRPEAHPKEAEWFPDTVFAMVKEGFLPGKSIGFIPLNFRAPEEKEIRSNPSWAKARGVIDKWLALEYSVVTVQSNPDALVQNVAKAKAKGIKLGEEFFERIGLFLPELPPSIEQIKTAPLPPAGDVEPPAVPFTVVSPMSKSEVARLFRVEAAKLTRTIDVESYVQDAVNFRRGKI